MADGIVSLRLDEERFVVIIRAIYTLPRSPSYRGIAVRRSNVPP